MITLLKSMGAFVFEGLSRGGLGFCCLPVVDADESPDFVLESLPEPALV